MAAGALGKLFTPIGLVLVIVGAVVAVLTFVIILLDLTGDFSDRIVAINNNTSIALILGGVALTWLGGRSGGSGGQ